MMYNNTSADLVSGIITNIFKNGSWKYYSTFADNTLTIGKIFKDGSKHPVFIAEGIDLKFFINTAKHFKQVNLAERSNTYMGESGTYFHSIDSTLTSVKAYLQMLEHLIPASRYWIPYLTYKGSSDINLWYLAKMIKLKDAPEAETVLKLNDIGMNLINSSFLKLSKAERKKALQYLLKVTDEDAFISTWGLYMAPSWKTKLKYASFTVYQQMAFFQRFRPLHMGRYPVEVAEFLCNRGQINEKDMKWLFKDNPPEPSYFNNLASDYHDFLLAKTQDFYNRGLPLDLLLDAYHRHPRNWQEQHQEQIRILNERREQMRIEAVQRKDKIFHSIYDKYEGKGLQLGNLIAYTSNNMEVWRSHAEALQQCIVGCDYYTKQGSILIFIKTTEDMPISTHEYSLYRKEIVQEHCNQADYRHSIPSEDCRILARAWAKQFIR